MTIEELRVLITAKTDSLQEGVKKAKDKLKDFKSTSDESASSVNKNINTMKSSYDSLVKKLNVVNAQAELQQRKLKKLREEYGRYSSMGTDTPKAMKLQEKILATESRLHNLSATSDKTAAALNNLDSSTGATGSRMGRFSGILDRVKAKLQQLKDRFRQTGNEASRSSGKVAGFGNMLSKSFMRVLKRIFIYNLIYKAIRGLMSYMGSAMKTNSQFASSLNTIQTNLRVAFQPIYDFILPAINALMSALATATTYIATFISALFGKTYSQSYKAAKGLDTAKKAMKGYGGAAEKAKGSLAGFDEISVMQSQKDTGGGGGGGEGGFEMAPPVTEADMGLIDRFKQALAEMFEPFKKAWENEGQNTINKAKTAFNSFRGLIAEIRKSFAEVWTNGTGQLALETILRILQQILEFAGRLAENFRIAWAENETGTKIIQGIADVWNTVLGIIESIGESINSVWGEVGQTVVNTFMGIIAATVEVLKAVAAGFKEIWDKGGKELFENLIKLGAKIFEIAGFIYTEFVAPFVIWFIQKISPAIGTVLGWIAKLVEGFTKVLDGFLTLLKGIKDGKLKEFLVDTWEGIKNKTEEIWNGIKTFLEDKIWTPIKTFFETTFGGIKDFFFRSNDDINNKNSTIWNGIKTFLVDKIWNPIKNTAKTIWEGIKTNIINPINQAKTDLTTKWNEIKTMISNKWDEIKTSISNKKDALIEAMLSPFKAAKDKINDIVSDAKNWGKNLIENIKDGIESKIGAVKTAAKKVADTIGDYIGFNSPAKKGPGSKADKWMPNLMNMMSQGLKDNQYKLEASVNMTAGTLRGVNKTDNNENLTKSLNTAIGSLGNNSGPTTIIVQIGEDKIIEKVITGINRKSRKSNKTLIKV